MKRRWLAPSLAILSVSILSVMSLAADAPSEHPPTDRLLQGAMEYPQSFMLVEQATSKCTTDDVELVITSARGVNGEKQKVILLPGKMQVFRADASLDDFTKQGGWYWHCGKDSGKLKFKQPGALIMIVRDPDGAVHWYLLGLDFRC